MITSQYSQSKRIFILVSNLLIKFKIHIISVGISMGENKEISKAPTSLLDQILDETFQKLENREDFDPELLLELLKLASEGSLQNDKILTSILKGDLP